MARLQRTSVTPRLVRYQLLRFNRLSDAYYERGSIYFCLMIQLKNYCDPNTFDPIFLVLQYNNSNNACDRPGSRTRPFLFLLKIVFFFGGGGDVELLKQFSSEKKVLYTLIRQSAKRPFTCVEAHWSRLNRIWTRFRRIYFCNLSAYPPGIYKVQV